MAEWMATTNIQTVQVQTYLDSGTDDGCNKTDTHCSRYIAA